MLLSMTGFASTTTSLTTADTTVQITLNIKSLNSRFFETTFKLPYALSFLETDLVQLCKSKLKRGHIFFTINMSNPNLFKAAVEPSTGIVQSYLDAIATIQKNFKVPGQVTITDIIQLPNIFSTEEKGVDEQTKKIILDATEKAVATLVDIRKQEGVLLENDIRQRISVLTSIIADIEKLSEKIMADRKVEIGKQLEALGKEKSDAAETQRITLYNELNKIDIHEEIVRFKGHLHNLTTFLDTPEVEKGKRVDFTLQELSRETNTIAAKCTNSTLSSLAITSKVELEKIREQIQNVV